MANERDFSFKCIKIALIVIHSLAMLILSIVLIASIVVLAKSDKKSMGLSPEEKDTTRKFLHNNG
jgi:5-bromo-4-chloroindolyl phosphate hydrolysis protein